MAGGKPAGARVVWIGADLNHMDGVIEKVMANLIRNNMKPFYVERKEDVTPLISELLGEGSAVAVGGSVSLSECGVIEHLRCGRYSFIDRHEPGLGSEELRRVFLRSLDTDAYLCGCNAITKSGELYNVDGNANRICAISYGPKSVIIVAGKNKIVTDISQAIMRVKTISAPKNCMRLGNNTYCREKGHCVSITKGSSEMTSGCVSAERICCSYLVTGRQRIKDRIKVIIVGEELGY